MNEHERKNMPPIRINDHIGVLVNFAAQAMYLHGVKAVTMYDIFSETEEWKVVSRLYISC